MDQKELDTLDRVLLEYGNDDSILSVSELDGFLAAIVSGPDVILPSIWYPHIWAGQEPEWQNMEQAQEFLGLLFALMNENARSLMNDPENYSAIFSKDPNEKDDIPFVAEWCAGYLRGVELGRWQDIDLPEYITTTLAVIGLHALDEYAQLLARLSEEQYRASLFEVEPAAVALHQYWLGRRTPQPVTRRTEVKTGRNDPCPCGSGKKYKQCCLH